MERATLRDLMAEYTKQIEAVKAKIAGVKDLAISGSNKLRLLECLYSELASLIYARDSMEHGIDWGSRPSSQARSSGNRGGQ